MGESRHRDEEVDPTDFTRRLVLMKAEAGRLKLWRTMHALDEATFQLGYEVQDRIGDDRSRVLSDRARARRECEP